MKESKLDDFDDNENEYIRDVMINDELLKVSTEYDNDITISEVEFNTLVEGMGIAFKNI